MQTTVATAAAAAAAAAADMPCVRAQVRPPNVGTAAAGHPGPT
jgi:hypothetical protein